MLTGYTRLIGAFGALISLIFIIMLFVQYGQLKKNNKEGVARSYRVQTILIMILHLIYFSVLLNVYRFEKQILLLFVGEIAMFFVINWCVEQFFDKSLLPLWSISQYLIVLGFVIMARLNPELGLKQFYLTAAGYLLAFIVAFIYHKLDFIKYLGIPAIMAGIALLLMTNSTINGANNWLIIGGFSFQPSEIVKVLYILFLASVFVLLEKKQRAGLTLAGLVTVALAFIQVFQRDLGSALIYYVVFILMCYVYTTNRMYIIGGGVVTLAAGFLAWKEFSHVQVRIHAWLDPWSDVDNKGYQIVQSLFAIGNGGLTGAGLNLGQPNKIPVVTTDFVYAAIVEEMGIIVGIAIIVAVAFFFLFGIQMLEKTRSEFDFLLGSGLVIVYGFQSFLIIGGVTRAVPLTGVTLPFVSYGGSSLFTTFIILGILQGIKLSIKKHRKRYQAAKSANQS